MKKSLFNHLVHGGDYNPDQWIDTPEIWDEDIRLMKLAHINNATVGIFSWSLYEPEEGKYNFEWLDTIIDKLYKNGIDVILATPSGARPPWLAQKYPEVLRVEETGIRNEYGVRHNHCLTSPLYREKVHEINTILAQRYKDNPAIKMWHISNEYCGECHCELCQNAFREWLKKEYDNDLDKLNFKWWNGFWSHRVNDWNQISSPKFRGENHVYALQLAWKRFVTDQHISFYENEIEPLRKITPNIPITTNLMRTYNGIDYQKLSKHLDIVSWDNYPRWELVDNVTEASYVAFCHDSFRTMGGGKPFFMMESTPSNVNWQQVNKLPKPHMQELSSIQAVSCGADSVQYFQWRKSRGGHEKFHGAVVDHSGHENTRVFSEVSCLGSKLEKLSQVVGAECESKVAIIADWENSWAVNAYCGYNSVERDYFTFCSKWYKEFWKKGISVDVIAMDDDYSKYDIIIAPYLYMLKDGTIEKIEEYVKSGGNFISTFLFGIVDKDDLCFLGGFPANNLKDVFGVWCEETDSILPNNSTKVKYLDKEYDAVNYCDILHSSTAEILGTYNSDFYSGSPCVTKNYYGKGKAYYVAFDSNDGFIENFVENIISENKINADCDIKFEDGISIRKRGDIIFVMNFTDESKVINLDKEYFDVLNEITLSGKISLSSHNYLILK